MIILTFLFYVFKIGHRMTQELTERLLPQSIFNDFLAVYLVVIFPKLPVQSETETVYVLSWSFKLLYLLSYNISGAYLHSFSQLLYLYF
jgi:hypothetical protein